jgi:hypothetical protein
MNVVWFAAYECPPTRQNDGKDYFAPSQFIKALKGRSFNGYADLPRPNGTCKRLIGDSGISVNRQDATDFFGEIAANYLRQSNVKSVVLVPIPSSGACIRCHPSAMKTLPIAQNIVHQYGNMTLSVADLLRWQAPMQSAHSGVGTRSSQVLQANLRFNVKPQRGARYILIDDVITSGGHMLAAEQFISRDGGQVLFGMVAGRTVYDHTYPPFGMTVETI